MARWTCVQSGSCLGVTGMDATCIGRSSSATHQRSARARARHRSSSRASNKHTSGDQGHRSSSYTSNKHTSGDQGHRNSSCTSNKVSTPFFRMFKKCALFYSKKTFPWIISQYTDKITDKMRYIGTPW